MRPKNLNGKMRDSNDDGKKARDKPKDKDRKEKINQDLVDELLQPAKRVENAKPNDNAKDNGREEKINQDLVDELLQPAKKIETQVPKDDFFRSIKEELDKRENKLLDNLPEDAIRTSYQYLETEMAYNKDMLTHPSYSEVLYSQLLEYYINGKEKYELWRYKWSQINDYYYEFLNTGTINDIRNQDGNKVEIDCYNDKLGLGLGVQGRHHYLIVNYGRSIEKKNTLGISIDEKINRFLKFDSNKVNNQINHLASEEKKKIGQYKRLLKSFSKNKMTDRIKKFYFLENGKLLIQAPVFIHKGEYYEFITEGFKEERNYRIKSSIDGEDRYLGIKPFYFSYLKSDNNKENKVKEVKFEDFSKMSEKNKLNIIEGYKITIKSPIKIENDEIIGIWGINRNYNKNYFSNIKLKEYIDNNKQYCTNSINNANFNQIVKFSNRTISFNDERKISTLEYIQSEGWTELHDEKLAEKLCTSNLKYISYFLIDSNLNGVLLYAQKGNKRIYFPIDSQNLILEKDVSPTKKREIIVQGGEILEDWLSIEKKKENAINYIIDEGWTSTNDKTLANKLGFSDLTHIRQFLYNSVNDGVLLYGQRASKIIFFPKETENLIIEKDVSPTKKREIIFQDGEILEEWFPMEQKKENVLDYIYEKGWTSTIDDVLHKKLGYLVRNGDFKYLNNLASEKILKGVEIVGSTPFYIFVPYNTQNLTIPREESPTDSEIIIVQNGVIKEKIVTKENLNNKRNIRILKPDLNEIFQNLIKKGENMGTISKNIGCSFPQILNSGYLITKKTLNNLKKLYEKEIPHIVIDKAKYKFVRIIKEEIIKAFQEIKDTNPKITIEKIKEIFDINYYHIMSGTPLPYQKFEKLQEFVGREIPHKIEYRKSSGIGRKKGVKFVIESGELTKIDNFLREKGFFKNEISTLIDADWHGIINKGYKLSKEQLNKLENLIGRKLNCKKIPPKKTR